MGPDECKLILGRDCMAVSGGRTERHDRKIDLAAPSQFALRVHGETKDRLERRDSRSIYQRDR
jgi:hypothetical protein